LLFDRELHEFRPDLVFAFGGFPGERRRYQRARRQGAKVVFALRNSQYLAGADFLREMDSILTPSQFLTDFYREATGVDSQPMPTPLEHEDVISDVHDPIFFTMINPSRQKGVMLLARLAEDLSVQRPDIPLLVVESRGSAGELVQAGLSGGFDLRRHENIMISPALAQPKEIYQATRALLVPSLGIEAAGRVVAEALVNGIPPLVSDRGGLPETCNGAGFQFPVPPEIGQDYPCPVSSVVARSWVDCIVRLEDDAEHWKAESARAREAGKIYLRENLAPRYVNHFAKVLDT
jgi:glycosyltransferase involved in cell wall biosynthesis